MVAHSHISAFIPSLIPCHSHPLNHSHTLTPIEEINWHIVLPLPNTPSINAQSHAHLSSPTHPPINSLTPTTEEINRHIADSRSSHYSLDMAGYKNEYKSTRCLLTSTPLPLSLLVSVRQWSFTHTPSKFYQRTISLLINTHYYPVNRPIPTCSHDSMEKVYNSVLGSDTRQMRLDEQERWDALLSMHTFIISMHNHCAPQ